MSTAEERMQNEIDELEQENRLLRARNDRLEAEAKVVSVQEPAAWSDSKQSELNGWFLSLPAGRQAVLLEDKWMLAGAAFLAGKTTPPAAKQWIGLSDEQKLSLEIQGGKSDVMLAELIESWSKEKNS
jgi:hypothetical protein